MSNGGTVKLKFVKERKRNCKISEEETYFLTQKTMSYLGFWSLGH